jgi:hypothetical protein
MQAAGVEAPAFIIFRSPIPGAAVSKSTTIPTEHRQTIFRTLIEAQDAGQSVAESRKAIAKQYGVTEDVVKEIEKEGIDEQWPPL